jgi:hypothetical protein
VDYVAGGGDGNGAGAGAGRGGGCLGCCYGGGRCLDCIDSESYGL